ncbi:TolC family protein [bacterium]|nr:TolC family protein [bacterium]MBU1882795.1 TolC family protein [bacterium]
MIRLALLLIPMLVCADDLKSLLDFATKNSDLVVSKTLTQEAKSKELASQKSAYFPTLDIGAFYQRLDERSPYIPGDTYAGYAKVGLDIYDGGKKSSLVDQKENELKSSGFDMEATKKSLSLQVVQDFFTIKTLEATLEARMEADRSLKAQLYRMTQFYIAKIATKDDVDRLQAAYDTNVYNMESVKLQILSAKKQLELQVGKNIETLDDSSFKELNDKKYDLIDSTKALMAQKDSIKYSAESLESVYYPVLRVEDSYTSYGYDRSDILHPEGAKDQNKLMVTLNMRLFDNGTIEKSKEAVLANAQALGRQINYLTNEQKVNFSIAEARLDTSKAEIKSALSALNAAKSAFKTIEEKYNAGIADNVTYLDALSSVTDAKALYTKALNDEQIAYATYYFYSGKNIEENLK